MSRKLAVCAGKMTEVSDLHPHGCLQQEYQHKRKDGVRKQSLLEPPRKQATHLNIKFSKFKLKFLGICGYCHWTNF